MPNLHRTAISILRESFHVPWNHKTLEKSNLIELLFRLPHVRKFTLIGITVAPTRCGAATSQAAPVGQKHSLRNEFKLHNHNVSLYIQGLLNSESTMFKVVRSLYPTTDIPSTIQNTNCTRRANSTKMLRPQHSLLTRIAKGHNITPSHTRVEVLRHGNPLARKENKKCQNPHRRVSWYP